jgi:glutamate-1-semialdehyde 2,1-aminomutase
MKHPNTVSINAEYPSIDASDALWARAQGLIPAGTQTLAKGPGQYIRGVAPKYLARGKGAHVWDVDGNEYIDFQMGIGPLVLGYCNAEVDDAIRAQLDMGITFSQMHPLEVTVAETVRTMVPGTEMVRFSKTGCDVTTAAVRVARAFTGRERVVMCGYHGWHDWYIAVTDRSRGIPEGTKALSTTFGYNDIASLEAAMGDDVACVILEPMVFEAPKDDFLQKVRALCNKHGALLVFDEMWTGFRLAKGGAQEAFDVKADLACFSKAIANGMPLSAITGRADVMSLFDKDVFFFTTFGGEALSLAAAQATMNVIARDGVPAKLAKTGKALKDGYNQLAEKLGLSTKCGGYDARSMISFDAKAGDPLVQKSLMQQELFRCGVLWGGFHNMCAAHSDADVAHTLRAYEEALGFLKKALASGKPETFLRGQPVEPVFRRVENFNMKPAQKA